MAVTLAQFFNSFLRRNRNEPTTVSKKPDEHFLKHSDFDLFNTFLNELLPDPDMVLKKANLTSSAYYELMTDPHVGGVVMQRKSRVKRMDIVHITGEKDNPQADKALEFFKEQMDGLQNIPEMVNDILDAPYYGATYLEMFFDRIPISSERPNGAVNLIDIQSKPFEWFVYEVDTNILKAKSVDTTFAFSLIDIPVNKILSVVKDGTYRNPYGERAFKRAFWAFQFKKGGLRFWTEFLEKYGMPFLFGHLDPKKSQTDLDEFHDKLVDMVRNGVVVSNTEGGGEEVEVVESKTRGESSDSYSTYKNTMNSEISKAILGETLTIENAESGSQSATETHLEILEAIQDEDRSMVERTFDKLARLLTDLNFGVDVSSPKTVLSDPKELKLKLAQRDAVLVGDLRVRFKKEYIAKTYKIEEEDFDLAKEAEQVPPVGGVPPLRKDEPEPRNGPEPTPPGGPDEEFGENFPLQNGVDKFIEGSIQRMEFLSVPLQKSIISMIASSSSYPELSVKLATLKDKMDNATFVTMFSQSLDIAYTIGEYGINQNKI